MLKSKEKLLNLTKVFFKYFFALLGIIVSLILTLGIVVNLLELSNTGSLIGNFGFLIADKFYYYFGTPGLIISISGFIASARFLTNSENKEISKKIFFVLLITIATGGLFKIFKELFSIAEYKFIGFIPSKITAFLVKQITGYLGTTLFYLFILFFSIQQLNKELILKLFNKFINLIKSIFLKKSNNKKAINIKEKPNDEIKINIEETLESNPVIDIQPDPKEEDKISPKNLSNREGKKYSNFILPNLDLLDEPKDQPISYDKEKALDKAKRIEEKLENFGINGQITEIKPGPVITLYEYRPEAGTKINKISSLSDDLAMALKATRIRIIAPIPGKDVIGIEVPNDLRETVYLKELLSKDQFKKSPSPINLSLGKDISGIPLFTDLKTAPHLMIAGTTGSGKSVFLHSIITSMLYKATPKELKFIMIDPKMLELSGYEDIPHLLHPVVTNPKKASAALKWAVKEMETRYKLLSDIGVRDIDSYNKKIDTETENLPFIVIIIDELADLMFVAPNEIKESITRLSQMARAAGIHLIVASQRPSADVVAGLIKANFPARISFAVSSKIDSRIILDASGAEEPVSYTHLTLPTIYSV